MQQGWGPSKEERVATRLGQIKAVLVALVQSGRQAVGPAKAEYDGLDGDLSKVGRAL
jgi:hypothetical protein